MTDATVQRRIPLAVKIMIAMFFFAIAAAGACFGFMSTISGSQRTLNDIFGYTFVTCAVLLALGAVTLVVMGIVVLIRKLRTPNG